MGIMDKFINTMKLNDDEYDEYEDDYEDDDEVEENTKRKAAAAEEDAYEEAPKAKMTASKVLPMKQQPRRSSSTNMNGMEVCVIKPTTVEDAREITETLLCNRTVVLNLEGLDVDIAQRIIDFTSGSCFAIGGNLQKISNYIFIITPKSVDISGDFQEVLSGAFDVPAFNNPL